jgi:protein-S-isoprenylcysteine O-methyltransferase Ste14
VWGGFRERKTVFSRLSRGERFVVVAGGILLVNLIFFPWHRSLLLAMVYGDVTLTGLQKPNQLQGTLAFLITVAMVAQVVMTKNSSQRVNPALVKLQAPAGFAVLALLAWKLANTPEYLSVGAYLGLPLAAALAYGGLIVTQEKAGR